MSLPLAPLLESSGLSWRGFRELVGSNTATLRKAEERGLTFAQADRWAVKLGKHPVEVWGAAWLSS